MCVLPCVGYQHESRFMGRPEVVRHLVWLLRTEVWIFASEVHSPNLESSLEPHFFMYVCLCECVCLCAQKGKTKTCVGYPLPSLCLFLWGRISPWTWGLVFLDRLEASKTQQSSYFPSRWNNRCLWDSWLVICVLYKWTRLFSNMWWVLTVEPPLQPPSFERNKWGWSDGLRGKGARCQAWWAEFNLWDTQ